MTFRPRTATVVTKPVDASKLALDAVAGDNVRWHGKSVMVMETALYERNGVEVRIARIWDGRRSHDVFVTELERK